MSSFKDLIDNIHSSLHSYTGVQEQVTYLTSPADGSTLSLSVASSDEMNRGIVEIDSELIYVDVADANVLTLTPFGRGFRGSTAAAHGANTQVTFDPVFPRSSICRSLVQAIQALFPTLWQIKTVDIAPTTLPIGYQLPADCQKVLEVKFQPLNDPYDYWQPLFNWSFDPNSPESNGRAINLFDWVPPGSTVRIVYEANFSTFAAGNPITDLINGTVPEANALSTLGLNESWVDLLTYATAAQMIRFLDPARLQIPAVENATRSQFVAAGDATKVANQLYAVYQQRLADERKKLLDNTPPHINFQR